MIDNGIDSTCKPDGGVKSLAGRYRKPLVTLFFHKR